eukprot:GGOE01014287.1.p1 GENE.GGOE01014287.1~~GGOE01014287.1.p1  ORF type:complete len:504 (+),score=198.82 GGOE01014287.1:40-1512(+)
MAAPGLTFTQALRAKYVDAADEPDVRVGGKKVELVGMKEAQMTTQDCRKLRTVSLRDEGVAAADEHIAELCPSVTELDLSCSRFTSWQVVTDICSQLPRLASLDLSCNELVCAEYPSNAAVSFPALRQLVLNKTKVPWQQVESFAPFLQNLQELNMETNNLSSLSRNVPIPALFPQLQTVNLTQNLLSDWVDLAPLQCLPRLHTLVLNDNRLTCIPRLEGPLQGAYPALTSLSITNNAIRELTSLDALTTFPGPIRSLRLSPLTEGLTLVQARMLVIPRLPQLEMLNNSRINPKERSDAHRLFLQACAQELRTQFGVEHHRDDCSDVPKEFCQRHPQYTTLVRTVANPLPEASQHTPLQGGSTAPSIALIMRSLAPATMAKGDKPRRFPPTHTVGKLKSAFQALYGTPSERQRLVAKVNTGDGIPFAYDLDDDFKDLQFYCLIDGTIVEMHERDLETEAEEAAKRRAEREGRMQQQLKEGNSLLTLKSTH